MGPQCKGDMDELERVQQEWLRDWSISHIKKADTAA